MDVLFRLQEGSKERFDLLVDGEKWREVHRAIFGKQPSLPPVGTEEELQAAFDLFEYQRVKGYVLWRLSVQSYHSEQLAKLLHLRLVQGQTVERVLQEYKEKGFLDDEAWLQSFVRTRRKRYAIPALVAQLRAKGLSPHTLQFLAEEWDDGESDIASIQHLLQTRYRLRDLSDYKSKQKVVASLLRKGYSLDRIRIALHRLQSNLRSKD